VVVLFASQSGNALKLAREVSERAAGMPGLVTIIHCLNQYEEIEWSTLTCPVLVVVSSSYGMGEAPLNGKQFEKFLKSSQPVWNGFNGVRFAVLGIGNSLFPKFCGFTVFVDQKLEQMGGIRLVPRFDGDDKNAKHRTEAAHRWMDQLFVLVQCGLESDAKTDIEDLTTSVHGKRISACSLCLTQIKADCMSPDEVSPSLPFSEPHYTSMYENCIEAPVVKAEYLTSSASEKRVVHVELDVSGFKFDYRPGDAVGIPCRNDDALVTKLLHRLGFNGTEMFEISTSFPASSRDSLESVDLYQHLPDRGTARYILTCCCDITSAPSVDLLELLSDHCTKSSEKEELRWISESYDLYSRFVATYVGLLDILECFPSSTPPFDKLLENLQPLRVRYFSISSSPIKHFGRIHLGFNIIERRISATKLFRGLCTSWLESAIMPLLKDRNSSYRPMVPIFLRPSSKFIFSDLDSSVPIVLVGPGTGCVPFRGLLHQLSALDKKRVCWLFVGSKSQHDFLYKEDWRELKSNGVIDHLFTAFSQDTASKWAHVQDAMLEKKEDVFDLICRKNAFLFVCGNHSVYESVIQCIKAIICTCSGSDIASAERIVEHLVSSGKIVCETWG